MLFSIITVSLNAQETIADTINSVLSQDFDDYEIIVKDGCSTDDTVKKIPKDNRIRIIVQEDTGIYNAMNQGIEASKGKYLLFLNCGDSLYSNDVLSEVAKIIKEQTEDCIVYGNINRSLYGEYKYPDKVKKKMFYFSSLPHQASYFARGVFEKVGYYDENMMIVSDRKYFLDCVIKKIKYVHIDKTLCNFTNGGISETPKGYKIARKEMKKVIKQNYNLFERMIYGIEKQIKKFGRTKIGQVLVKIKHKIFRY